MPLAAEALQFDGICRFEIVRGLFSSGLLLSSLFNEYEA